MSRLIVVEDPGGTGAGLCASLRDAGHDVHAVGSGEVVAFAERLRPDAVVATRLPPGARESLRPLAVRILDAGGDVLGEAAALADGLDESALLRLRRQLRDSFDSFLALFLREAQERTRVARDALSCGDRELLGRQAHTLKPTCSLLGAHAAARRCAVLESACRGGESDLGPPTDEFIAGLSRLRERLEPMLHDGPR